MWTFSGNQLRSPYGQLFNAITGPHGKVLCPEVITSLGD